jgi:hypothetical protein
MDTLDECPQGDTGWLSEAFTDADGDGCRDFSEDLDDDGDGLLDDDDECPNEAVNNISDENGDGCIDVFTEPPKPFFERFLEGDLVAMGLVLIPLLLLFTVGSILYSRQNRSITERKLRDLISDAETPMHLSRVSSQATDMFLAKLISEQQHDAIQNDINSRRIDFGDEAVDDADNTEKDLARVFSKAVGLGLTTKEAVVRMEGHIAAGRFSPEHYLKMWSKRIDDVDIVAVVDEEVSKTDSKKKAAEKSKSPSKPSISSLNRMKKAELVSLAKEMGVPHSGTKAKLIDAIREEE